MPLLHHPQRAGCLPHGSRGLTFVTPWSFCHSLSLPLPTGSWFRCRLGEGLLSPPLFPLGSVCSLTPPLSTSHQSCWVVRSLPAALCFPSSSSSLSKCCWHLVAQVTEERLSQSVVSILLLIALLHDEDLPRPGAWSQWLSLVLEGWVLGFQNPKQGASTTGRNLSSLDVPSMAAK